MPAGRPVSGVVEARAGIVIRRIRTDIRAKIAIPIRIRNAFSRRFK
jgi:hypothetical protein